MEDDQQQHHQQQECSEKLEDEDSNYESMAEDINNDDGDFEMSPPVVSVNETSCDSISNEMNNNPNDKIDIVEDISQIDPQSSQQQQLEPPTNSSSKKSSTNNKSSSRHFNPLISRGTSSTRRNSTLTTSASQRRHNYVVQSRLNFSSRSPSPNTMAGISSGDRTSSQPSNPALLHEGDTALENFIVDDIGNDRGKKSARPPRQSRINFLAHTTSSSTTKRNNNRTSSSSISKERVRSKKSQGSKFQQRVPPLHDVISDEEEGSHDGAANEQATNLKNRTSNPIFRIKVRISSHCLLVPCQQANVKTIEWLIEQVRFTSLLRFCYY